MQALQMSPEFSLRRIVFKLRFYRELAGVSQKEAAEKLHIGHRSYQRIEGGETNVDITFLLRFSQLFNMNFLELVTPYPPELNGVVIYKTPEELNEFENLPYIKNSHFLEWSKRFLEKAPTFDDCKEFTSSHRPMVMWTPSKKCMNDSLVDQLNIKKEFRKVNFYFLRPDDRLKFLDTLYYYKPKYSLKRIRGNFKRGLYCEVELYSVHLFHEDELLSFSFVHLLPSV